MIAVTSPVLTHLHYTKRLDRHFLKVDIYKKIKSFGTMQRVCKSFLKDLSLQEKVHLTWESRSGRNANTVILQLRCHQQAVCVNHTCVIITVLSPAPIHSLFPSQTLTKGATKPSATLHLLKEQRGRMTLWFVLAAGLVLSVQPQQCGGRCSTMSICLPTVILWLSDYSTRQHQPCRESKNHH